LLLFVFVISVSLLKQIQQRVGLKHVRGR
jgi:hypothetical protein